LQIRSKSKGNAEQDENADINIGDIEVDLERQAAAGNAAVYEFDENIEGDEEEQQEPM